MTVALRSGGAVRARPKSRFFILLSIFVTGVLAAAQPAAAAETEFVCWANFYVKGPPYYTENQREGLVTDIISTNMSERELAAQWREYVEAQHVPLTLGGAYCDNKSPDDLREFQADLRQADLSDGDPGRRLVDFKPENAQPVEEVVNDPKGNIASLAIDRRNGSRYGWAVDYKTVEEADARALEECGKDGSKCHVVLRFTGGCGAYAADFAKGSTVYGWGTARARQAAESRAHSEARRRGGTNVSTRVWGCNSVRKDAPAKSTASGSDAATGAAPVEPGPHKMTNAEADAKYAADMERYNAAMAEHDAAVKAYDQQLQSMQESHAASQEAAARAKAAYEAELAKARQAQAEFEEKQRQYREEFKKATGRYPEE